MKKTAAPTTTLVGNKTKSPFDQTVYQRSLFLSMAMNLTWQLAIVVVVPMVGGYKLDEHFGTTPWLTLAGLALAALGFTAVLVRIVHQATVRVEKISETNK
jgi:F0F1-type ATP synthase assembly protein I